MRRYVLSGVALATCAAVVYFAFDGQGTTARGSRQQDETARARAYAHTPVGESGAERADKRDEDGVTAAAIRQALLNQLLSAKQAQLAPDPVDPLAQIRDTLDRRLSSAAPNPQETARMEQALRAVIDSQILGETAAAVTCGATMCRVDLSDADDSSVQIGANAFAERVPKMFASSVVYPQGTGQRAMYLAARSDDLVLGPPASRSGGIVKDEQVGAREN